uniref:Cellular retinoic acid-binding protein 2-like n=1 Tax=Sinocyclocheilus grahami TaxID=75366 RepID=A0A672K5G0_SINGR
MGPLSQPFGSVDTPSLDPNYSFKGEFTKYTVIAVAAASKPAVEITQQGESLSIQTSTSVRTTYVSFTVGESFNETTVDGRPCTSFPKWETDRKITCEQTLQKGEGPETSWTRELTNDGQMILVTGDVVCTRVYERD